MSLWDADSVLQLQDVNGRELDALVEDYLLYERRVRSTGASSSSGDSNSAGIRGCLRLRACLLAGNAEGALQELRMCCPVLLEEQRLIFKIRKLKFVEHVRLQTPEGDRLAVAIARDELAPLALHAYPEAYLEFKRLLLLLVYKNGGNAPDAVMAASPAAKEELAAMAFHTARQTLGLQEPRLTVLLRYLLHLFTVYQLRSANSLPQREVVAALLKRERDAPALAPETSSLSKPDMFERDIQSLIQCTGTSRANAVSALRTVGGNLKAAFRNELARLRINEEAIDGMIREYAAYRGLTTPASSPAGSSVSSSKMCWAACGRGNAADAMDVDAAEGGLTNGPAGGGTAGVSGDEVVPDNWELVDWSDNQTVLAPGGSAVVEALLVRQGSARGVAAGRSMSQSPPTKLRCACPLEEGEKGDRAEQATPTPTVGDGQTLAGAVHDGDSHDARAEAVWRGQQEQAVQALHQLARENRVTEIIAEVEELDSSLFKEHPALLFELQRCRFRRLLECGDVSAALLLARNQLTPLANRQPTLLPLLRPTMAALLPDSAAMHQLPQAPAIVEKLQAVLLARLGLQGPQLLKLLQVLLAVHRAWLRRENVREDPFMVELRIAELLQPVSDVEGCGLGADWTAAARPGLGYPDTGTGRTNVAPPAAGPAVDDVLVERLIEILELPRSAAITLLQESDYDVEGAVARYLS